MLTTCRSALSRPSPFHRAPVPGYCWVCARYIGPALACSYCEAPQPGGTRRIWVRALVLVFALLGILWLWIGVQQKAPAPARPIGGIVSGSGLYGVRIEGTLIRQAGPNQRYPTLWVQDRSGIIRVNFLNALGSKPGHRASPLRPGRPIAVLGSLSRDQRGTPILNALKWNPLPATESHED